LEAGRGALSPRASYSPENSGADVLKQALKLSVRPCSSKAFRASTICPSP